MIAVLVVYVTTEEVYYHTADDQIEVDKVVNNPVELQAFIDCFLDRNPCTTVSQSYKDNLEDAVKTACLKCTTVQKKNFLKFIVGVQKTVPQEMEAFKNKYDPKGIYFSPLLKALSEVQ
ncbi:unnamed protein product [Colias eurytheme]|nr:unnamed protein product [Colias eurytheme]